MRSCRPTRWIATMVAWSTCAGGCASTSKGEAVTLELLTYDSESAGQALDRVVIDFPWELQNFTTSQAVVDAADWKLEIETEAPLAGNRTFELMVAPGATGGGKLTVEAPLATSPEGFAQRKKMPMLRYWLTATFRVKGPKDLEEFEAEWNGHVFPPREPEVTLQARAGRYGGSSLELNFTLGVSNSNPFAVVLDGMTYSLYVDEVEIAKGKLARGNKVNAASELQYEVQRLLGKDDLHELAKKLLGQDVIPYRLDAKVKVGEILVDAPITGEISFAK